MSFVKAGATSQSLEIQVLDDDGLPVSGLVAATFPATYYQRTQEAPVQITPLVDLAAQNSAYTTKGVKELTGGRYRLDVPDAAFATASKVTIIGEATGKRIIYPTIDCGLDLTGTSVKLTSDGLDAVLVESGIAASSSLTNDTGTQLTSINVRQAFALFLSTLAGVLSGVLTNTLAFKPGGKSAGNTRVSAAQTSDGRTTVTLKVPD